MIIGSLFSGIGGLELGLERAGIGHTVWQCERDQAAQRVLRRHWPNATIHDDVRTLDAAEPVDVLCGGFPCQDLSVAGRGAGLDGARSGLWFEYLRVIRTLRPRLVIVENVAVLVTRGLDVVLGGLAASWYDATWFTLRASDVGAPHRRERLFIIARRGDLGPWGVPDADGDRVRQFTKRGGLGTRPTDERYAEPIDVGTERVADGHGDGRQSLWPGRLHRRVDALGHDADGRGSALADVVDASRVGRGQGRTECAGRERVDAPVVAGGATHEWPPGPSDRDGWAVYLTRYPHRAPAVTGRTGRPQLSPAFVEALMGFPDGWTDGESRTDRLRMLGNAVVPHVAEAVGLIAGGLL